MRMGGLQGKPVKTIYKLVASPNSQTLKRTLPARYYWGKDLKGGVKKRVPVSLGPY